MEESEAIHKYTHGLKPHVCMQVRLGNYQTLEACMKAALTVDGSCF